MKLYIAENNLYFIFMNSLGLVDNESSYINRYSNAFEMLAIYTCCTVRCICIVTDISAALAEHD